MKSAFTLLLASLMAISLSGQTAIKNFQNEKSLKKNKAIKSLENRKHQPYHISSKFTGLLKSTQEIVQRMDSTVYEVWDFDASQWVIDEVETFTYDTNGNMTLYLYYYLDEGSNPWIAEYKTEHTYYENGFLADEVESWWDFDLNEWILDDMESYTYNDNGSYDIITDLNWDESSSLWINDYKYEYTYDANDLLTWIYSYEWIENTSEWDDSHKEEYIYDQNGHISLKYEYYWSESANDWIIYDKAEYTCDANGNPTTRINYYWSESNNQWEYSDLAEYTYDTNGNPTLESYSEWSIANNLWEEDSRYEYTYNLDYNLSNLMLPPLYYFYPDFPENISNQPLDFINYEPDEEEWIAEWRVSYFYSEQNLTGVSNISETSVNVFPNPTSETVTISLGNEFQQVSFEIFNLQGKRVMQQNISNNATVDIKHLPAGIFFYRLSDRNVMFYIGKILKK